MGGGLDPLMAEQPPYALIVTRMVLKMEPGAKMPEQMGMNLNVGIVTHRAGDPFAQVQFAQGLVGSPGNSHGQPGLAKRGR